MHLDRDQEKRSLLWRHIQLWNGLTSVHHLNESCMLMMDADLPKAMMAMNSSAGLRKWGRKCVLLMLALSTKVVLVSPLLPFIIPYLVFPFSLPACLHALPSKATCKTLTCAKLAGLHKHRWNGRLSALQRWASVKLIFHRKVASHKGYIATWAMWALGRGQSCQQANVHITHSKGFIPISSQI